MMITLETVWIHFLLPRLPPLSLVDCTLYPSGPTLAGQYLAGMYRTLIPLRNGETGEYLEFVVMCQGISSWGYSIAVTVWLLCRMMTFR